MTRSASAYSKSKSSESALRRGEGRGARTIFVPDRDWVPAEGGRFRPERELTLGDEADIFSWRPVNGTQTGLIQSYDIFVERILKRKRQTDVAQPR